MNRPAYLIACLGLSAAAHCLAEAPAFCTSMCSSEQRQCRAQARLTPQGERRENLGTDDRNPLARTAQREVPSSATRAMDAAGTNDRQASGMGACDAAYQRCTRACTVPANSADKAVDKAVDNTVDKYKAAGKRAG
jgi:hypothetical protein